MTDKFSKVCRVCGNLDGHLISIFDGDGLEHNLPLIMKKHLYPVDENDVLPTKICYQCISVLISWSDLYDHSMRVNKDFKQQLKTVQNDVKIPVKTAEIALNDDSFCVENTFCSTDNVLSKLNATLDPEQTIKMFNELEDFDLFLNESSPSSTEQASSDNESVIEVGVDQKAVEEGEEKPDINNEVVIINFPTSLSENHFEESVSTTEILEPEKVKQKLIRKRNIPGIANRICSMCGKVFSGRETLRIHIRTVHSDERPFICQKCGTAFKRKDHLDSHIKSRHDNIPHRKKNKRSTKKESLCIHCGKILSSSHLLREHVNSFHSNNMPYKCLQCNISFSRYSGLYHHRVKRKHKLTDFKKACEHCGLEFENEIFYIRHKWKHEENLKCDLCEIDFENSESFKNHIEVAHEETKLLQCDTCGKKFGTKTSLQCHVKCHSDDKPFECQYCAWRFHKKSQLVVHIYRHTGERPHVCSVCGKGFKQKGDMRKHKASHLKKKSS